MEHSQVAEQRAERASASAAELASARGRWRGGASSAGPPIEAHEGRLGGPYGTERDANGKSREEANPTTGTGVSITGLPKTNLTRES